MRNGNEKTLTVGTVAKHTHARDAARQYAAEGMSELGAAAAAHRTYGLDRGPKANRLSVSQLCKLAFPVSSC